MLDINNIFISSVLNVLKVSRDMITKLNLDVLPTSFNRFHFTHNNNLLPADHLRKNKINK